MADDQAGPSSSTDAEEVVVQSNGTGSQESGDKQKLRAVTPSADKARELLNQLALSQQPQRPKNRRAGDPYAFWGTQPVAQFNEDPASLPVASSQIVQIKHKEKTKVDSHLLYPMHASTTAALRRQRTVRLTAQRLQQKSDKTLMACLPSEPSVSLLCVESHSCCTDEQNFDCMAHACSFEWSICDVSDEKTVQEVSLHG